VAVMPAGSGETWTRDQLAWHTLTINCKPALVNHKLWWYARL
jgi:hypothetical protein